MKYPNFLLALFTVFVLASCSKDKDTQTINPINASFDLKETKANYDSALEQIEMSIDVEGLAGASIPSPIGGLDGAPVFGYVFPTSLSSNDVGFGNTDGIVAMALTSHPDFDDTPLWDENNDKNYANDGAVWHPHWVLLVEDTRVSGGLSVKQFQAGDPNVELPPTNPGMPMYMDSPGYQVIVKGHSITVVVPTASINNQKDFHFDAISAQMKVNTSDPNLPMLGVYEVINILSGDLSLPYSVN